MMTDTTSYIEDIKEGLEGIRAGIDRKEAT
jgi:hypothetical protein